MSQRAATLGPQGHTAVAEGGGSPTLAPSVGLWERRHIQVVSCQLGVYLTRFFGNVVFVVLNKPGFLSAPFSFDHARDLRYDYPFVDHFVVFLFDFSSIFFLGSTH